MGPALVPTFQRRAVPGSQQHVLDIGSGSGLLAMMAVRAGAARVSSLEMVPAMAAVARHCIAANGFGAAIKVHELKSTDVEAESLTWHQPLQSGPVMVRRHKMRLMPVRLQ